MSYETLLVEREGVITWLTLNRPEALNAMNRQRVDELREGVVAFLTKREPKYTDH